MVQLQVVLANKGDIDAVFSYIHSQSMFGPLFTFSPSQGIVRPGGYQAIKVCFNLSRKMIENSNKIETIFVSKSQSCQICFTLVQNLL